MLRVKILWLNVFKSQNYQKEGRQGMKEQQCVKDVLDERAAEVIARVESTCPECWSVRAASLTPRYQLIAAS